MANQWFKFYGQEFLTDMKMQQLSIAERLLWVTILCLASAENKEGNIPFCTEELLKSKMGLIELDQEWQDLKGVLGLFKQLNMIEITKNGIFVKNFQRRQDSYLLPAEKMKRYRDKLSQSNKSYPNQVTKVTTDKNREEENRKEKKRVKEKKGENKFSPPSLNDVKSYCEERQNSVSAENFINFYESKGWLIGKNKMKSWQAAVRTWENREQKVGSADIEIPDYVKKYE